MSTNKIITLDDLTQFATNLKKKFINENTLKDKQDLIFGHLYDYLTGYVDSEACVFDFTDNKSTSDELRVYEKRGFIARMVDPIVNGTITGFVETEQFFAPANKIIYIEQLFKKEQNANSGQLVWFKRKGSVQLDNVQDYKNWVATKQASITWQHWIPVEYPEQTLQLNSTYVTAGNLRYTISGSNMTVVFDGIVVNTTTGALTITTNFPTWIRNVYKPAIAPMTSLHNNTANISVLATCNNISCVLYAPATETRYWGSVTVPLGY